jgi:hypothetical protein
MHELRRSGCQLVEVLAVERIDQVDFSALEAQHLDIAVGLNVEPDRIEIRQLPSLRVRLPVVGIALQQQRAPGFVIGHHERSEHRHFFFGGVRGKNRNLIEEAIQSGYGRGKRDRNLRGRNDLRFVRSRQPERNASPVGECRAGSINCCTV